MERSDRCAGRYGHDLTTPAFAAGIGGAIEPFVYEFMVFVIAIFVGYYVVWSVTPALHTPLMSVTNAISSVIVVGALLAVRSSMAAWTLCELRRQPRFKIFGFLALAMASVNIFGGFLVTQRMLAMYKKKGDEAVSTQRLSRPGRRCNVGKFRRAALSRRGRAVHSGAARPVEPGDLAARQLRSAWLGMAIAMLTTLGRREPANPV